MKLNSKIIKFAACVLLSACSLTAFAACNDPEDPSASNQGYVMEAEYINLDGVAGAGISSDQGGVEMIYGKGTQDEKDLGWSNGYFVGYTYATNLELNFEFNAETAGTASITLRLGSELGDLTLDSNTFEVSLNGKSIRYRNVFVEGSTIEAMKFYDRTITTSADLQEGANKITLKVLENDFKSGKTGGPTIDCIKIKTDSKLTWTDKTDNPSRRGSMFG